MGNNAFRVKSRVIHMSIIAFITIITMAVVFYSLQSKYSKLNEMWLQVSALEQHQTKALATINQGFGYGGFIHHYKNYILRHDDNYLKSAQAALDATYAGINDYLDSSSLLDGEDSRKQMLTFKATVDNYAQKLQQAHQLVLEGNDSATIDKQVYVDDSEALRALEHLFYELSFSTSQAQNNAKLVSHTTKSTGFYATVFMLFLIALVLLFFIRQSKHLSSSYQQIRILVDAAPDAIIQADTKGKIVLFNKKALTTFGYTESEFSGLYIEDLMPKQFRERHVDHRRKYHDKTSNATMNSRTAEFSAQRKNGEVFPVSVSLSAFSTASESGAISILKDLTAEKELVAAATKDHLTSLDNRRSAEQFFEESIQHFDRQSDAVSVIMVDIDHFKNVNDNYGHAEGDRALKKVADLMRLNVRDTDLVARWGGEEFLIICPATDKLTAHQVAEKIRKLIEKEFEQDTLQITVSAGIAAYDPNRDQQFTVILRADKALYQSKDSGRNCITVL